MNKIAWTVLFAVALLAGMPAHARDRKPDTMWGWVPLRVTNSDRLSTEASEGDTASVLEPNSILMLGSALLTLAGLDIIRRNS